MRKQGGGPEVFHITGARTGLTEDVRGRQRRYIISMSVRTLSVILTVVLWNVERPLAWVTLVLGALLPYVAVVYANAGRENTPAAPASAYIPPAVRPALEPSRIEHSTERAAQDEAPNAPHSAAHGTTRDEARNEAPNPPETPAEAAAGAEAERAAAARETPGKPARDAAQTASAAGGRGPGQPVEGDAHYPEAG